MNDTGPEQPPQKPTPEEWAQAFRSSNGRPPTTEEYRAALDAGEINNSQNPSFEQMGEHVSSGFRSFADGAKDFYGTQVAPSVEKGSASAKEFLDRHGSGGTGNIGKFARWASYVLPAAGLLAVISLFLPFAGMGMPGGSFTMNYFSFSSYAGGAFSGVLILLLSLAAVGTSIAWIITKNPALKLAAGVSGGLGGVIGIFSVLGHIPALLAGLYPSIGFVLLALMALVLIAGGAVLVVDYFQQKKAAPEGRPAAAAQAPRAPQPPRAAQEAPAPQAPTAPPAGPYSQPSEPHSQQAPRDDAAASGDEQAPSAPASGTLGTPRRSHSEQPPGPPQPPAAPDRPEDDGTASPHA